MFNLNKIIYRLLILLLLEFSLLGMYIVFNSFFSKGKPIANVSTIVINSPILSQKEHPKSLEDVLIHISPNTTADIVMINNQMVKPIIYTKSIKLSQLSIENKKKTFINMIIPSILVAKHEIKEARKRVLKLQKTEKVSQKDALWLTKKRYIFKAKTTDELYDKMELHPTSIVMAQAIIESGWGTSRFFEKANNVFGIWSFNPNDKRIAASEKRGKKTVYLKKYVSVEQSI